MTVSNTMRLNDVIHGSWHDGVGILTIDNPPVNASSAAVRAGLLEGIARFSDDDTIRSILLIGAEKNFVSGSDLNEFNLATIPTPELPEVIEAIRAVSKPVIAAISGATLGGGLELALGCDYRVALSDTIVGLPETTLGMIPGAGGTQRTLRLIGPAQTIQLATSGTRFPITDPTVRGLVDHVAESDLQDAAVQFSKRISGKRDLLQKPVPALEPGILEDTATQAIASSRGRPETIAAVGAILAGLALPSDKAMLHERHEFTRLRNSPESEALRHIFFAQRTTAKSNRPSAPVALNTVAVVGAGTMGGGIARAFADHGIQVMIHDQQKESLEAASKHLKDAYQRQAATGKISEKEAATRTERISYVSAIEDLHGADLYIEAVFEDLAVKSEVLRGLEPIADGAIIATNTSYLNIELLADVLQAPENLLGIHFFSPAHRTPLVEVVYGERTQQAAFDMAFTAAKRIKKIAVRSAVGEGFIGNRIFNAYRRQSELILEEGALPAEVDAAMRQFGFAMGPFEVADMSGLDIAWRMRQRTADTRNPEERYPDVADTLCELGRFGQKTGAGWYQYGDDGRTPISDPEVTALIQASSSKKLISRRTFMPDEIAHRMVLAMANEAALIVEDGIADRASDVDVMMVRGYGFPDFRGGPTQWVRQQNPAVLQEALSQLQQESDPGFRVGNLELLTGS